MTTSTPGDSPTASSAGVFQGAATQGGEGWGAWV